MNLCAHVSTEPPWGHPLCIYFWPAAGSSSLTGVRLCEGVSEVTSVAFTCSRGILFSQPSPRCYILVQSVTEDVKINLDPYICSSEAVLWPWLGWLWNLSSESNIQPCTLMKHHTSGSGLSLLRWRLFSEGNCLFFLPSESRNNRQPDEERALPFQSLSAVWLMNYGWGYRLFSSALLHWPTLNSIPSWSETSWEMLSFPCAYQPRVQKPTQTAEPSFVSLG